MEDIDKKLLELKKNIILKFTMDHAKLSKKINNLEKEIKKLKNKNKNR